MLRPSPYTKSSQTPKKLTAIVICFALLLSTTPLATADSGQAIANWLSSVSQHQANGSRPGAPEGVFPNLDEMRGASDEARLNGPRIPNIPAPIPSTRRRWRQEAAALEGLQPSLNAGVDSSKFLAYAFASPKTGSPWRTELLSSSILDPMFGLFRSERSSADYSAGFAAAAALTPQGSANFAMARLEPQNRTGTPGVDLLSGNFNWNLSLIGLRGRSGLDLGLGLAYNSKVWTRSGMSIAFDYDNGTPAPGFRLGFPVVQGLYYHSQAGTYFYLLITPSGQRVELRRIGTSNVYQTVDATYAQLTDYGSYLIYRADGAQLTLVPSGGEYHCTQVKDRNGNYLTITYNAAGDITTVTDTLGRVINFNYDGYANLISLTQTWGGQTHTWATFGYGAKYVGNNFPKFVKYGPNNSYINVLTQVGLADGSRYNFEYNNNYGIVSEIRHIAPGPAPNGHERRRMTYQFATSTTDCPRVSAQRQWAENWNGDVNGEHNQAEEAITLYGVDADGACRMTLPNGVIHKEYYGSGWQAGLTTLSEVWSGGVKKKWTTTTWTQDNTGVIYLLNPRITETNVYDAEGNRRRTTIYYGPYEQYSLPYLVTDFAANGTTEIRHTYRDYHLSQAYLDRRIIGLVSAVHMSNTAQWQTKVTYGYDDPTKIESLPAAATRHDPSFNTSFLARGNVTSVSRWDVDDINNSAKALTTQIAYNVTGSAIRKTDPSEHSETVTYSDSFSDGLNNRNTFAYPTTKTDGDGFSTYTQYNFDFDALTRIQEPPPAGQSQGAITTMTYDAARRIQWINNQNNSAWKFFTYSDRGDAVMSQETINAAPPSYWSITILDGANRVRALAGDHYGLISNYSATFTYYDVMGNVWRQSNPAETNSFWVPTGDDAGWVHTEQTYDWQGRPLVTTNPDGTTKETSYGGCGCAGGAVVTVTDEGTVDGGVPKRRQQKIYSDVLGRTVKTEELNWQGGSVYSATVNTYNARDQISLVRDYPGAEGSSPYQETIMTYDGYGRLKTRHVPEQNFGTATTWDYHPDDTVQKITDARGASKTFTYNGRHLETGITYSAPVGIPGTGPVSLGYDAAGNRTSMTDGAGSSSYSYDQLSRITSETRYFSYTGKSYLLSYGYNLAGNLTSVTDTFGQVNGQVNYARNHVGKVTGIAGTGTAISNYASGLTYRAWGARKHITYGNSMTSDISYNSRLLPSGFHVGNANPNYGPVTWMNSEIQYYADGRLKNARDLVDNKFDRAYGYDHVGRVREAYTNQEARNFLAGAAPPAWDYGPYRESFTFDVNDNMTSRVARYWSQPTNTLNVTFNSNNRNTNPSWQYDAEGRVLSADGQSYVYDAAGRLVNVPAPSYYRLYYDGDGNVVRRVEGDQFGHELKSFYNVQSSVMGGRVIFQDFVHLTYVDQALIGQTNAFNRFVYVEGELLAKENKVYNSNFGPYYEWIHQNPVTGSSRGSTEYTTPYMEQGELDAGGINVGLSDPNENPPPSGGGSPTLDPEMPSGCTVNGIQFDCAFPLLLLGNSATRCPFNECSTTVTFAGQLTLAFFNAYADGYEGYVPVTARYRGRGNFEYTGNRSSIPRGTQRRQPDTDFPRLNNTGDNEQFLARTAASFLQKSLVDNNPASIQSDPKNKDCNISVSFTGSYSWEGFSLPNGESDIASRTGPRHGLGFTVSGSVRRGGIGQVGSDTNPANRRGAWTLQQYVWNYAQTNGAVAVNNSSAYQELSLDVPMKISGNRFDWYDHPDIGAVSSHYRKVNFVVKAVNGNKQCEVQFHALMVFDGKWNISWGSGNY